MFVDNNFFDNENASRMALAMAAAMFLHAVFFVWLTLPVTQETISSDVFSAPTNVRIRLITPVEKRVVKTQPQPPVPIIKTAKIKPTAQPVAQKPSPQILSKTEPAAAPTQKTAIVPPEVIRPIATEIPVVSGAKLRGRRVQPSYPKRSLRMRQEGVVWLHVLISESGIRQDIKLHKPSRFALLNQAAMKAVKKWTFDPNIVNGRAVKSWVEIPIEFKIQ